MPSATTYPTDPASAAARRIEEAYQRERAARTAAHDRARRYYAGEHHRHLRPDATGTEDNLTVNLIEAVVDKSVGNLLGADERGLLSGVTFRVVGGDDRRQGYLDAVWAANRKDILLLGVLLDAALTGHAFIKVVPGGRGEFVRLVGLNPSNVAVFWAADDVERPLWYRVEAGPTRQDIVSTEAAEGEPGGWLITNYTRPSEHGRWAASGPPEPWPYPWPPLVDWPNLPNARHSYYGKDDVGSLGQLNDGLNFTLSNTQRILKHHAHPKTVATGVAAGEIEQTSVGGLWAVPGESARVFNLEMQSDLGSSLNFANLLRRLVFDLARELDPGSVQDRLGDVTNFGLRVLFRDSLAKGGVKRLLAGDGLARLNRRLLALGGFGEGADVAVEWPDPLPTDPLQTAQALSLLQGVGLSADTALERAGFDPAHERVLRNDGRSVEQADRAAESG